MCYIFRADYTVWGEGCGNHDMYYPCWTNYGGRGLGLQKKYMRSFLKFCMDSDEARLSFHNMLAVREVSEVAATSSQRSHDSLHSHVSAGAKGATEILAIV